jgi:ribose transport system substrate-binding protein
MHVNRPIAFATLAFLTAAMPACQRKSGPVIGMVPKGATQMFWQAVHAGAIKAAREAGVELLWNAPAHESDSSRQVAMVEAMINRGVDALAIAPVDRSALATVANRAIDRGIPVAVFDSALDATRIVSFVATDNREGGRVAARRLGDVLKGKGKLAVISDMPGSASTTARIEGFQEEIKAKYPAMEVIAVQFVMADRAKARSVTENWLVAHAELAGIFADHENAAIGAALALASRGNHSVRLVGFDASEQLAGYLAQGWIDSLVVQNPFRMGYETVRALTRKLAGNTPAAQLDTGSTLVTAADLAKPEIKNLMFPDVKQFFEGSAK